MMVVQSSLHMVKRNGLLQLLLNQIQIIKVQSIFIVLKIFQHCLLNLIVRLYLITILNGNSKVFILMVNIGLDIFYSKSLTDHFFNYSFDVCYDSLYSNLISFYDKSIFIAFKNSIPYMIYAINISPAKWNKPDNIILCTFITHGRPQKLLTAWKKFK